MILNIFIILHDEFVHSKHNMQDVVYLIEDNVNLQYISCIIATSINSTHLILCA